MPNTNYGDRVQARAEVIASDLDNGDKAAASKALQSEMQKMSPQEFDRLLREVQQNERKNTGYGFDLVVGGDAYKSDRKGDARDTSYLIIPSAFEKPVKEVEKSKQQIPSDKAEEPVK